MILWLLLCLTGLAATLDKRALPCGWKNERCCVIADIPEADRDYYESDWFKYHDWADPKGWCWGEQLFCIKNKCVTEDALTCGKVGERCCKGSEAGGDKDKPLQCRDGNFCVKGKCAANVALPCGENKERCCQLKDLLTSEYYDDDSYSNDNPNVCFSRANCFGGSCVRCTMEGDKCCGVGPIQFCKNNYNCKAGRCTKCGAVGQACCDLSQIPENSGGVYYDYGTKNDECLPGLNCLQGECNYCGFEGNPCCGKACKVKGLVCNPANSRCEACGMKDELCCPGGLCSQPFLKCGGGRCRCGQLGQGCCNGVCAKNLKCSRKKVCVKKPVRP